MTSETDPRLTLLNNQEKIIQIVGEFEDYKEDLNSYLFFEM